MVLVKEVEVKASSAPEAIAIALRELGVTRDDVEVNILNEETKGLFGLDGPSKAKVRVTLIRRKKR